MPPLSAQDAGEVEPIRVFDTAEAAMKFLATLKTFRRREVSANARKYSSMRGAAEGDNFAARQIGHDPDESRRASPGIRIESASRAAEGTERRARSRSLLERPRSGLRQPRPEPRASTYSALGLCDDPRRTGTRSRE
jgi:hypothetical protein